MFHPPLVPPTAIGQLTYKVLNIIGGRPKELDNLQLQDFEAFVLAGGEVTPLDLSKRIYNAEYLVLLFLNNCLSGIGAVKNPSPSYRQYISDNTDFVLDITTFPYELGWIFVLPSARRRGLSHRIVDKAITYVQGAGIFSTSRINNKPMHRTLEHFGFTRAGQIYASNRGNHKLQLFTLPSK